MNRQLALVCAALVMSTASCSGSGSAESADYDLTSVDDVLSVLEEDGISCENLTVRDAEEIERERAARPEHTPGPHEQLLQAPEYPIREAGVCQIEGSPQVRGEELASTITIYEDDAHLQSAPERGFPGVAIVYGDNWLIQLSNAGLSGRVAALLDGKAVPPLEVPPLDEAGIASNGPRCFFMAALPPGLDAAFERLGVSTRGELARTIGDATYYEPEDVRARIEQSCRQGLEMEAALRRGRVSPESPDFEDFWMRVCAYARSDFRISHELGFVGAFSLDELGSALTNRFLEKTAPPRAVREGLARRCGKALSRGAIVAVP